MSAAPPSSDGRSSDAPFDATKSSPSASPRTSPILTAMPWIAAFAVVTTLVGRGIGPALIGVFAGMGHAIAAVDYAGAWLSQGFACAAIVSVFTLMSVAARSNLPVVLRMAALTLGWFPMLPTFWALRSPLPELTAVFVSLSASLLAVIAANVARRAPFARLPALVIGFVAVCGLLRASAVALALGGHAATTPWIAPLARALSTAGFFCDAAAVALALAAISARGKRLASPATLVVVGLSLLGTRQALLGHGDEARAFDLFVWRLAEQFTTHPDPSVPVGFRVFVAFLAPLTAAALLASRSAIPALTAAMSLALLAHGSLEMPPAALMLIMGSLGVALAAQDGRSLWSAIAR